jgi:xylonate dehydratase
VVEIVVDRRRHEGRVDLVATAAGPLTAAKAARLLERRSPHPGLAPRADLPADTRLWATLQEASGGIWAGCVYDPDRIEKAVGEGRRLASAATRSSARSRSPKRQAPRRARTGRGR